MRHREVLSERRGEVQLGIAARGRAALVSLRVVGFGRIIISAIEALNILANLA